MEKLEAEARFGGLGRKVLAFPFSRRGNLLREHMTFPGH